MIRKKCLEEEAPLLLCDSFLTSGQVPQVSGEEVIKKKKTNVFKNPPLLIY